MEGTHISEPKRDPRRKAFVRVTPEMILQVLFNWTKQKHIALPVLEIPDDAHVMGVWYEFRTNSFEFLLNSDEFDLVGEGMMAPELGGIGSEFRAFKIPHEVDVEKPEVSDMVKWFLEFHGYDGLLCMDGECACDLDDLNPCSNMSDDCTAGYKVACDGKCEFAHDGCDWHMVTKKPEVRYGEEKAEDKGREGAEGGEGDGRVQEGDTKVLERPEGDEPSSG